MKGGCEPPGQISQRNMNKLQWGGDWNAASMRRCAAYISPKEIAMFKAAVVVFALTVSGFMLWVAHENANFAQLPHATFVKRAA
jgi:hypothetical protein